MPLNAYFKVCLNSDQKLYVHQHYLNENYYYFYACLRIQNMYNCTGLVKSLQLPKLPTFVSFIVSFISFQRRVLEYNLQMDLRILGSFDESPLKSLIKT